MPTDHADPAYTAYSTHTADAVDWYARDYPGHLNERAVALMLGIRTAALARWRAWNPALVPPHSENELGDVVYAVADVFRWLNSSSVNGLPQFPWKEHAYPAPSHPSTH